MRDLMPVKEYSHMCTAPRIGVLMILVVLFFFEYMRSKTEHHGFYPPGTGAMDE